MSTTADTTLLESWEEVRDGNFIKISVGGDAHCSAIINAVIHNYHHYTGRPEPVLEDLEARIGEKVTLIYGGENTFGAGMLKAREGKLFSSTPGTVAMLPKGSRKNGWRIDTNRVLDIIPGYSTDEAVRLVGEVRGHFPVLKKLTRERLEQLPGQNQGSGLCSLAVFGGNPLFGAHDCVWLIGEYWPEDDICDRNVLLIRPEFGVSESGSCYGFDLLNNRAIGEVVDFEPIPFSQAIELCDDNFDYALAHVIPGRTYSYPGTVS